MRSKTTLDRRTRKEIERFLREKHAQLKEALRRRVGQRRVHDSGRPADAAVWAAEALTDEIQVALMDRESRQVSQIEAALERLQRGRYGICHDCADPIELARLRVLPFAQRCSACQARAERRVRTQAAPARTTIAATDGA
ncbi:MAG: TraR/DksA family transcriptional regulator [Candidatus Rokubacteria bacterium]|nr:TraR/DksA family transcriptional regulator [Candidatus Rokubacteria bacterium]